MTTRMLLGIDCDGGLWGHLAADHDHLSGLDTAWIEGPAIKKMASLIVGAERQEAGEFDHPFRHSDHPPTEPSL